MVVPTVTGGPPSTATAPLPHAASASERASPPAVTGREAPQATSAPEQPSTALRTQPAAQLAQVDLSSNSGAAGAVVMVVSPEGATSGVLVDSLGHVLTNWHSVRGYDALLVVFKQSGGTGAACVSRRYRHGVWEGYIRVRSALGCPTRTTL